MHVSLKQFRREVVGQCYSRMLSVHNPPAPVRSCQVNHLAGERAYKKQTDGVTGVANAEHGHGGHKPQKQGTG